MKRKWIGPVLALLLAALWGGGCYIGSKHHKEDQALREQIKAYNAQVKNEDDKIVCKKIARTGTRIPEMVCATRRDWRRGTAESQDAMRRLRPVDKPSD